jgi:hypothetical protein
MDWISESTHLGDFLRPVALAKFYWLTLPGNLKWFRQ